MLNRTLSTIMGLALLFMISGAYGQLLDNDTLFIGDAFGEPGEQVVISVDIVTSEDYAGWQVPMVFGTGSSPVVCDSVSLEGSIMTDTTFRPGGWDFIAPFMNNREWDNMQTCGVAGIIWLSPPTQNLPAGTYHIMDLYFSIDDSASQQTIVLDTMGATWYAGGPVNHYIVVVPPGYSRITHVVQGSITITGYGVEETGKGAVPYNLEVFPTIARIGEQIIVRHNAGEPLDISVYDATGRVVAQFPVCPGVNTSCSTRGLRAGVYFVAVQENGFRSTSKIILY